jgi:hypothetical protein
MSIRAADPIDCHVGTRIRKRRTELGRLRRRIVALVEELASDARSN